MRDPQRVSVHDNNDTIGIKSKKVRRRSAYDALATVKLRVFGCSAQSQQKAGQALTPNRAKRLYATTGRLRPTTWPHKARR